jgi:AraC family transcriptional regulator
MSDDTTDGWRTITIGDMVVASGPVPGGTRFRRHEHEGVHVCCVLEGGFVEARPGGREDVGPGTVRVSPSARHDIDFARQGARCAVLHLAASDARRDRVRDTRFVRDPWVAGLVARLGGVLADMSPLATPRVEESIVELLAQIQRRREGRAAPPPPWLRTARELVHDDPTAATLGALAERLNVHRVHLARAFRDHYGETIGDQLRRVRLLRAMRLLRESDAPLSRVAADAGFADQSHMTRALRSSLGLTPAQARRTLLSFKTVPVR